MERAITTASFVSTRLRLPSVRREPPCSWPSRYSFDAISFHGPKLTPTRTATVRVGVSFGPWKDIASKEYRDGQEQGGSRRTDGNLSRVETKDAVVMARSISSAIYVN